MAKKNKITDTEIQLQQLKVQEKQFEAQITNAKMFDKAIEQGLPLLKDYLDNKMNKVETPKFKWTIGAFGAILLICVIGSGLLVFFDKMDSGSFTFLLGTLIGGIITFIGDVLLPKDN